MQECEINGRVYAIITLSVRFGLKLFSSIEDNVCYSVFSTFFIPFETESHYNVYSLQRNVAKKYFIRKTNKKMLLGGCNLRGCIKYKRD